MLATLDAGGSETVAVQAGAGGGLLAAYRTADGRRIRVIARLGAQEWRQTVQQSPAGSHALAAPSDFGLGLAPDQGGRHLLLFALGAPLQVISQATGRVSERPHPDVDIYAAAW